MKAVAVIAIVLLGSSCFRPRLDDSCLHEVFAEEPQQDFSFLINACTNALSGATHLVLEKPATQTKWTYWNIGHSTLWESYRRPALAFKWEDGVLVVFAYGDDKQDDSSIKALERSRRGVAVQTVWVKSIEEYRELGLLADVHLLDTEMPYQWSIVDYPEKAP